MRTTDRRQWLALTGSAIVGVAAGAGRAKAADEHEKHEEAEVTAAEDLMREHGVLRRALLVYAETSSRLAAGRTDIPFAALARTATLFRKFGEDYHERSLEEKHVFVPLTKKGGTNAVLVRTLTSQHERGREITAYVTTLAKKGALAPADAASLSKVLSSFVRMYQHHAAIEDTVIFPAWKEAISAAQYRELNEEFEDLEHEMFGKDGFDDAVEQIAAIEKEFGLADLAALTAPAPPSAG